ncbi:hypothetical protein CAPTEDRAFT_119324, partial [Capitella teleta]
GIVPKELKIARVLPLFKPCDRQSISNYKPISVLPILSKIFESIVVHKLNGYLE